MTAASGLVLSHYLFQRVFSKLLSTSHWTMGMPLINNYSVFRAISIMRGGTLGSEGFANRQYEELLFRALQSLEQFNMFAFVLNDSESNPKFDRFMKNIFDHLDATTGEKMLFFAVVAPQYGWELEKSKRSYYQEIRRFEVSQLELLNNPESETRDPSLITYAICEMLGIPYEALPILVITNNLYSYRVAWYQTDEHLIERQLNIIGRIANDSPEVKYDWKYAEFELSRQFNRYKASHRSGFSSQDSSLSGMLSECLSFVNLRGKGHEINKEARLQAANSIRKNEAIIRKMRNFRRAEYEEEPEENLLKEISKFALLLSLMQSDSHDIWDYQLSEINEAELEPESRQMLKSALRVHRLLHSNAGYRDPVINEVGFDYSGIIVQLAKMFEKELNLSFVHWMRKKLGISLPDYFNLYQPDADARYTPENLGYSHPNPVKFNNGYYQNWIPPTMGQSLVCFRSESLERDFYDRFRYMVREQFDDFIGKWGKLKRLRNEAAHNGVLNEHDYESFRNLLNDIARARVFDAMHRMKCDFRGRRNLMT